MLERTQHTYTFLISFLLTVFALKWWQQSEYLFVTICMFAMLLICVVLRRKKIWRLCLPIILGSCIALTAVARTTHVPTSSSIDSHAQNSFVRIRGTIVAEPDKRPMQTKYTIAAKELETASGKTIPVEGKVLITDRKQWPEFAYGDHVEVAGILEKPGSIETFHYDKYLSRYGIYAVMYRAGIKQTDKEFSIHTSKTLGILFNVKGKFEAQINKLYPEPHASFMAGLLTGSRRGIPEKLMEDFNTTGLTHIIAISGYNITIVITLISGMLFWLPLQWRLVPSIIAIVGFTVFVGASAAVVRAAIMGILGLLALHTGRQSQVRLTILWTLFFMLLWNPKYLWYDAGFQLSFLAVLGLVELGPMLDRLCKHVPNTLGIREALQMTCAAQISAVPLIVMLFGRFSLIAPLANILVAPFIPLAMLFGFLGTMLSILYFPLGQVFAYIGWGCLETIVQITSLLAAIPYASIQTPQIHISLMVLYYVIVVVAVVRFTNRIRAQSV